MNLHRIFRALPLKEAFLNNASLALPASASPPPTHGPHHADPLHLARSEHCRCRPNCPPEAEGEVPLEAPERRVLGGTTRYGEDGARSRCHSGASSRGGCRRSRSCGRSLPAAATGTWRDTGRRGWQLRRWGRVHRQCRANLPVRARCLHLNM